MLKLLTQEVKDFTNWDEAATWLATHGWGPALIEEQKLLWEEFKKSGTESAELVFDIVTGTINLVKPVVAEAEPSKPAVATKPSK